MSSHILIAILLTSVSLSVEDKAPCPENGCSNVTVYLGPRWGSKLIQYPNYPKLKGPSEQEGKQLINISKILNKTLLVEDNHLNIEKSFESANTVLPKHSLVLDDNSFNIDYKDPPSQDNDSSLKIRNANELLVEGTLNLTNLGIKGDGVKAILSSLSKEVREGLQRLYLNHNPLGHLYSQELLEISRLTNLKVLGLSGTSLRGLVPFDHPTLEILDLSNNYISQFPANIFNTPNLRELDLSNNRLDTLSNSFSNLRNLTILSLADNDMSLMSTDSLQSLNLQKLYLNNNKFHMLYQIKLDETTSPNVNLYLSGNPLECDCYVQENLMNRAWPKVADWDKLTCNLHHELRLVSDFANECRGILASLKLLPNRLESGWSKLHFFLRRCGVSSPDNLIFFLGLLFAMILVWLAFRMRSQSLNKDNMSKTKATVPYTILDSKQVP